MLAEQELLIKLSGAAFMAVLNFITNECWVFSLFALSELPSHGVCFSLRLVRNPGAGLSASWLVTDSPG